MHIRVDVPRIHGGKNSLDVKNKEKVLDFSLNVNPFPLPKKFLPSLSKIRDYPDFKNNDLKKLLAEKYNLSKENFFIGNGSSEIITLIFICIIKQGDEVTALCPTFSEYKYFTQVLNGKFFPIILKPPDFTINLNEISKHTNDKRPKLFFICNPVNPTGKYYGESIIEDMIKLFPKETMIVLDEAYINFTSKKWGSTKLLSRYPNLIVLRSLTKDFGLGGLRLGYSISSPEISAMLNAIAPSWNVNSLAQEMGLKVLTALKDNEFVTGSARKIDLEKDRIEKSLKKLGYEFIPSDVNFFLLKVKNATKSAKLLLDKNILVRDCTSLGLPNYLRVSINLKSKNDILLKMLEKLKLYE